MSPPCSAACTSASKIASLKLDADWVLLSACNTAAGGAGDADALAGLARAFIFAGARSLLVSHWAVDSQATVKLITGAMGRLGAGSRMGRAEALRQAMLALLDEGGASDAHPSIWAPFVVVGEGVNSRRDTCCLWPKKIPKEATSCCSRGSSPTSRI